MCNCYDCRIVGKHDVHASSMQRFQPPQLKGGVTMESPLAKWEREREANEIEDCRVSTLLEALLSGNQVEVVYVNPDGTPYVDDDDSPVAFVEKESDVRQAVASAWVKGNLHNHDVEVEREANIESQRRIRAALMLVAHAFEDIDTSTPSY